MKRVFAALNIQIFVCLLVSFMLLLCGCNRSETSSDAPPVLHRKLSRQRKYL